MCVRHKRFCSIKSGCQHGPLMLSSGFSCTSISALNNNRGSHNNCVKNNDGSTGQTATATYQHAHMFEIPLMLNENVPELLNEGSSELKHTVLKVMSF